MFGRKKNDPLPEPSSTKKKAPTRTYAGVAFAVEGLYAKHIMDSLSAGEDERIIILSFHIGPDEIKEAQARTFARTMRASQDFEDVVLIKKSDVKEELSF